MKNDEELYKIYTSLYQGRDQHATTEHHQCSSWLACQISIWLKSSKNMTWHALNVRGMAEWPSVELLTCLSHFAEALDHRNAESHRTQLLYAAFNFWNSQLANAESITLLLQKGPWQAVSSPHTCRNKKCLKKTSPKHVLLCALIHFETRKALRPYTLHCSTKIMIYNPVCVWSWITASK